MKHFEKNNLTKKNNTVQQYCWCMSDALGDIDIDAGEKTVLRGILAPEEGDDYIESYYEILRAIEQGTVYTAATKADLENKDGLSSVDEPLVGIAETEADEFNGESVHIYDGTEWVDTFQSVESVVEEVESDLENRIDDIERRIDTLDIDDIEDLRTELNSLDAEIDDIEDLIETLDIDDIENLRTELNSLNAEIDDIEGRIDTLDIDDIENLRTELNSLDAEIDYIEGRIDTLDIDDIEDLRTELNSLNAEIDDIKDLDIKDISTDDIADFDTLEELLSEKYGGSGDDYFEVNILNVSPKYPKSRSVFQIDVTVEVENTGGEFGWQYVLLDRRAGRSSYEIDDPDIKLYPGESQILIYNWISTSSSAAERAGEFDLVAYSVDDDDRETIDLEENND